MKDVSVSPYRVRNCSVTNRAITQMKPLRIDPESAFFPEIPVHARAHFGRVAETAGIVLLAGGLNQALINYRGACSIESSRTGNEGKMLAGGVVSSG